MDKETTRSLSLVNANNSANGHSQLANTKNAGGITIYFIKPGRLSNVPIQVIQTSLCCGSHFSSVVTGRLHLSSAYQCFELWGS